MSEGAFPFVYFFDDACHSGLHACFIPWVTVIHHSYGFSGSAYPSLPAGLRPAALRPRTNLQPLATSSCSDATNQVILTFSPRTSPASPGSPSSFYCLQALSVDSTRKTPTADTSVTHLSISVIIIISPIYHLCIHLSPIYVSIICLSSYYLYIYYLSIIYPFSSVAQSCLTLCDPMVCSTPGFPVHHQLPELAQTHIH